MLKHKIFIAGLIVLTLFLLMNFIPGCNKNKSTRSLYIEFNISGTWQEEYTIRYWQPSIFEWGEDVWVERDFISLIELKDDYFDLKIFDGRDSLLMEHSGNYCILGDTIFFDVVFNDSTIVTNTLGYKFLSKDSLLLHSVSYPSNDDYIIIELFGFAWQVPFGYDTMSMYGHVSKNSGIFIRQD